MLIQPDIGQVFRAEAGRVLATLIRLTRDFDAAEEALQDAFAAALERWPQTGVPENPRAWLVRTGHNRAIDRLRRKISLRGKIETMETDAAMVSPPDDNAGAGILEDDILRLIFMCCHPALTMEARVALALRTICGLDNAAVAHAFLAAEETMAQRVVRAKAKIRAAKIPYHVPAPELIGDRLEGVLAVIYLVFTEGYAASSGEGLLRMDLCREAIRLVRLLAPFYPANPGVQGLLALMLLHEARSPGRTGPEGAVLLLEHQDRSLWNQVQIAEGKALVETGLRVQAWPNSYLVQAAIAALHAGVAHYEDTDWRQIAGLYDILVRIHPSPVIELNRAAAIAMIDGPARALEIVDTLAARGVLTGYYLLPAARANFLEQLGRQDEARESYASALALAGNEAERRLLRGRLKRLADRLPTSARPASQ